MNMIWKQPIQTNLNSIFGDNFLAKHLYIELLLRASNTDKEKEFAGTLHFLKRGQCVCGEEELATEYQVHRQTIRGALGRLQKVYNKINIKPTNKGTIVTILNYDDVVSLPQQNVQQDDNRTTSNVQQKDTNKNVENVEIEKIEDNSILLAPIGAGTNHLISLFEEVNPSYKTLYANKTQRSALERMTKEHGEEKMISLISILPKVIFKPYCPQITTPLELENKMGKLIVFLQQEKNKINKFQVVKL